MSKTSDYPDVNKTDYERDRIIYNINDMKYFKYLCSYNSYYDDHSKNIELMARAEFDLALLLEIVTIMIFMFFIRSNE